MEHPDKRQQFLEQFVIPKMPAGWSVPYFSVRGEVSFFKDQGTVGSRKYDLLTAAEIEDNLHETNLVDVRLALIAEGVKPEDISVRIGVHRETDIRYSFFDIGAENAEFRARGRGPGGKLLPEGMYRANEPTGDGVAFTSMAHPGSEDLGADALEQVEIEIPDTAFPDLRSDIGLIQADLADITGDPSFRDLRRDGEWMNMRERLEMIHRKLSAILAERAAKTSEKPAAEKDTRAAGDRW